MIVAAAIIYDGVVWMLPRPARHHHIIKAHFDVTGNKGSGEQGFVDEFGQFYRRVEAGRHAHRCHQQFLERPDGCVFSLGRLFSEDLW